ncbi:MAG: pilus assembly protein [Geobacter sp.]|nr:pilus assembly protein [Geobacter sp.]
MHIQNNKGQTLVETALILIFLMLVIIGIMEFGRAMYFKNTANNAARGIARIAVVTPNLTANTSTSPDVDYTANCGSVDCSSAGGGSILFGTLTDKDVCCRFATIVKGPVDIDIDIYDQTGNARSGNAQTGDTVYVSVTIPFESLTRLITISPTLVGEASMRYE